jgi:hypothetical protein
VTGPLCQLLPSGDDPGAPRTLTGEPADVALTWIPVVTTFEAAVRASGLKQRLHDAEAITILAFSQPYGQNHQPSREPFPYIQPSIMPRAVSKIDFATFRCRGGSTGRSPARLLPNSWPSNAASGS